MSSSCAANGIGTSGQTFRVGDASLVKVVGNLAITLRRLSLRPSMNELLRRRRDWRDDGELMVLFRIEKGEDEGGVAAGSW